MCCPLGIDRAYPDTPIGVGEEHCWEKEFMTIYNKEIRALDDIEHKRLEAIEAKRTLPKMVLKVDGPLTIPNKIAPKPEDSSL
jgi:hypothetical protein